MGWMLLAVVVLGVSCLLLRPGAAHAGCCLSGSTQLTDYVGYATIDTGSSSCVWHFDHCNVTVYSYTYCEDGPDTVVSFRIHPGAHCNFYSILCLQTIACGYVPTSQGDAYECTRTCSE